MEVVISATAAESSRLAADLLADLLQRRPDAVLGLATGSSPLGIYDDLAKRVREGQCALAKASAFTLDEYVGLPDRHPQRYRHVIARDFVDRVDLRSDRVHGPDPDGADLEGAGQRYETMIREAGGVDLQILGIGTDGHIGFNEPGSSLGSRTRLKTLTAHTRRDNARFFDGDPAAVPRHCLTQGIGTILEARQLVMVASGAAKAAAVRQMVEGPVASRWPATALQFHPAATVFVDRAAAQHLELADYYAETYRHKPAWQHPEARRPTC